MTPLALDLTVHAGKGTTSQQAMLSATMEAIERVCAEDVPAATVRRGSWHELAREGVPALDPWSFDLPFETAYRPEEAIAWVEGEDLIAGGRVWVARDLVISPPEEGVCLGVETNGLAAGSTIAQATAHGLAEVIERDAAAHDHFIRRFAPDGQPPPVLRVIAAASLPAGPAELVAKLRGAGPVVLRDLTHDLGVPVVRATLTDPGFPGHEGEPLQFTGFGCDLDPVRAATAALCEVAQSHTAMLLGARDAYEAGGAPVRHTRSAFIRRLQVPTSIGPLADPEPGLPDAAEARIRVLCDRLAAAGLEHCVVADLTRPDIGIPVVRVVVPGLSGPYGNTSRRPARRLLRAIA